MQLLTLTNFVSMMKTIEYATQHDFPIFFSNDGGLKNGIATIWITILAPDIRLIVASIQNGKIDLKLYYLILAILPRNGTLALHV